eukprot:gene24074-biopygen1322
MRDAGARKYLGGMVPQQYDKVRKVAKAALDPKDWPHLKKTAGVNNGRNRNGQSFPIDCAKQTRAAQCTRAPCDHPRGAVAFASEHGVEGGNAERLLINAAHLVHNEYPDTTMVGISMGGTGSAIGNPMGHSMGNSIGDSMGNSKWISNKETMGTPVDTATGRSTQGGGGRGLVLGLPQVLAPGAERRAGTSTCTTDRVLTDFGCVFAVQPCWVGVPGFRGRRWNERKSAGPDRACEGATAKLDYANRTLRIENKVSRCSRWKAGLLPEAIGG